MLLKEGEEAPVSAARDARPAANGDADLTSTSSLDRFYGSSVRGPGGVSADSERIRDSVEPQLALLSHAPMQMLPLIFSVCASAHFRGMRRLNCPP